MGEIRSHNPDLPINNEFLRDARRYIEALAYGQVDGQLEAAARGVQSHHMVDHGSQGATTGYNLTDQTGYRRSISFTYDNDYGLTSVEWRSDRPDIRLFQPEGQADQLLPVKVVRREVNFAPADYRRHFPNCLYPGETCASTFILTEDVSAEALARLDIRFKPYLRDARAEVAAAIERAERGEAVVLACKDLQDAQAQIQRTAVLSLPEGLKQQLDLLSSATGIQHFSDWVAANPN